MVGWKVFAGGKMGAMPVIAEELASGISTEDVPKYMATVLRVYREAGEPNERLARMVARIGVDSFREQARGIWTRLTTILSNSPGKRANGR